MLEASVHEQNTTKSGVGYLKLVPKSAKFIYVPYSQTNANRQSRTSVDPETALKMCMNKRKRESVNFLELSRPAHSASIGRCIICTLKERRLACIPCGHIVTCVECGSTLKHCPMCNVEIKSFLHIRI